MGRFPKEESLRQQWISALSRRDDYMPSKSAVHFKEEALDRIALACEDTVPSVFQMADEEKKRPAPERRKHRSPKYCCVRKCKNNSAKGYDPRTNCKVKMHSFPNPIKERERCLKWIAHIDRADLNTTNVKSKVVCSIHFEKSAYCCPSDLANSRLLPQAAPKDISTHPRPLMCFKSHHAPPKENIDIPLASEKSETAPSPIEVDDGHIESSTDSGNEHDVPCPNDIAANSRSPSVVPTIASGSRFQQSLTLSRDLSKQRIGAASASDECENSTPIVDIHVINNDSLPSSILTTTTKTNSRKDVACSCESLKATVEECRKQVLSKRRELKAAKRKIASLQKANEKLRDKELSLYRENARLRPYEKAISGLQSGLYEVIKTIKDVD